MSLREISENMKLAREYALLGNYSSASVLYRGLLEQIKNYVCTVRDGGVQQRWQQVNVVVSARPCLGRASVTCPSVSQLWQEISEENRHVQDIMSTLESFQLESAPAKPVNHDDCDVRPVQMEPRYAIICKRFL